MDMQTAPKYAVCMARHIQIRNVPEQVHRRLKARAAMEGRSLSEMLLAELVKIAERPSIAEMRARLATRSAVRPLETSAEAIRAERDSR